MKNKQFTYALIASLLAHILLFAAFSYLPAISQSEDVSVIEFFLDKPDGGWQIADIPEPAKQEKPDKAKFLGMYSQKAREETVAETKIAGSREQGAGSNPPSPPLEKGGKEGFYKFDKGLFAMKSPVEEKGTEVSKGGPITPEASVPEDFYPDFKLGEHTYLNVLRYPEVEYFVRLKRIFKTTWNPMPALRQESLSVSRGMVSVVVAVAVDKIGELSELFILKSSGISGYDSEAIRTVRASSPFSTPPEKFIKNDALRMSWTFMVYL